MDLRRSGRGSQPPWRTRTQRLRMGPTGTVASANVIGAALGESHRRSRFADVASCGHDDRHGISTAAVGMARAPRRVQWPSPLVFDRWSCKPARLIKGSIARLHVLAQLGCGSAALARFWSSRALKDGDGSSPQLWYGRLMHRDAPSKLRRHTARHGGSLQRQWIRSVAQRLPCHPLRGGVAGFERQ